MPHLSSRLPLCALLLAVSFVARAQDPVFSQYSASPVYSNPALAGFFEGVGRASIGYRDQWASPLEASPVRTYAAAGEMRQNIEGRDYFGLSVLAVHDVGGRSRFAQTRANLGGSVHKYLSGGRGRDATVGSFGLQVGYGQHQVKPESLWFSSQLDTSTLLVGPGEPIGGFIGQTRGYLDLNTGLNLAVVKRDYGLVVGLATHHINQPNISFLYDLEERLPTRFQVFVAGEYLIKDELRILPSATYQRQAQSSSITSGAALYYRAEKTGDAGLRAGTYLRASAQYAGGLGLETMIVLVQLDYARTTVGISYDINVGRLGRTTDARGGFELSMSYTLPESFRRPAVVCPKL